MNDLTKEFIDRIQLAAHQKRSLVIEGRGTKKHLGRASDANAEIISVAKHSGIVQYEPVELVMTARAGTSLAEIDAVLEENQQMLACEPARYGGQATIGGSLATNQSGPARPWWGSLRDHVLGVNLINGSGEHLHFGGQVMKNVAGYDVSRLQAGAMGTLGLMTEISFKVMPKPAASLTLCKNLSMEEAIHSMNQLSAQAKPLTGAAWQEGVLYLRISGAKSAVEGTADKWEGEFLSDAKADQYWQQLRDLELSFFTDRSAHEPLWRFSIKSTASVFKGDQPWLLDWSGALRWLKGNFDRDELQQWAEDNGGEVVKYMGGDRTEDVFQQKNSILKRIQQDLKHAFDSENIFNRGRLYSWM